MLLKIKENYIFIQVIILKDLNCDKKLLKNNMNILCINGKHIYKNILYKIIICII